MLVMMMNTEKLEALEDYLGFDRDYYKPIRTDDTFDGERNNYLEYKSRGDRYENLSPKKYLKMIRPYLKDLINDHIPVMELDHEKDDSDTERGEWKVQLVMQNNYISTKDFEDTLTIYSASKPVEVFVGTNTNVAIDRLFDILLQRLQQATET